MMRSTDFVNPTHFPNIMGANKRVQQMSNRGNGHSGSKAFLEGVGPQGVPRTADQQGRPTVGQPYFENGM